MTVIGRTTPKAPEPEVIEQQNVQETPEPEEKTKKSKKDDAK